MSEENGSESDNEAEENRSKSATEAEEYYAVYNEYNKTLRQWFVAFGIGAPVLFLLNNNLIDDLKSAGVVAIVVGLFFIGVSAQIIIAFINKVAAWYNYWGRQKGKDRNRGWYWLVDKFSDQFWIDVLFDAITIGLFGSAAWITFKVFAA